MNGYFAGRGLPLWRWQLGWSGTREQIAEFCKPIEYGGDLMMLEMTLNRMHRIAQKLRLQLNVAGVGDKLSGVYDRRFADPCEQSTWFFSYVGLADAPKPLWSPYPAASPGRTGRSFL